MCCAECVSICATDKTHSQSIIDRRLSRAAVQALAEGGEPLWKVVHRNVYGEEDNKKAAAKKLTTLLLRYAPADASSCLSISTPACVAMVSDQARH